MYVGGFKEITITRPRPEVGAITTSTLRRQQREGQPLPDQPHRQQLEEQLDQPVVD